MPRKDEPDEEEVSIADLAKKGLDNIVKLSQSQIISEKLQSLDILLFVFILALNVTHYLGPTTDLALLFLLVLSFLFALVASLGYGPILSVITNVSTNKIESLRVGITMLFVALTLAIGSLILNIRLLASLSLGLTGIQLTVIPLSGFLFPRISVKDEEIGSSQLWIALGRISAIIGVISFIIDVALIVIGFS